MEIYRNFTIETLVICDQTYMYMISCNKPYEVMLAYMVYSDGKGKQIQHAQIT